MKASTWQFLTHTNTLTTPYMYILTWQSHTGLDTGQLVHVIIPTSCDLSSHTQGNLVYMTTCRWTLDNAPHTRSCMELRYGSTKRAPILWRIVNLLVRDWHFFHYLFWHRRQMVLSEFSNRRELYIGVTRPRYPRDLHTPPVSCYFSLISQVTAVVVSCLTGFYNDRHRPQEVISATTNSL